MCITHNGRCETTFDAYYLIVALLGAYGLVWLFCLRKKILALHFVPKSDWIPKI